MSAWPGVAGQSEVCMVTYFYAKKLFAKFRAFLRDLKNGCEVVD